MSTKHQSLCILLSFFLVQCATYSPQYADDANTLTSNTSNDNGDRTFYFIGDAGNAKTLESTDALIALEKTIETNQSKDDYLIYLGDNIYDNGLSAEGTEGRDEAEYRLNAQLDVARKFDGHSIFIPGNHDWRSEGLTGLKRQEKYIKKAMDNKKTFQPKDGCPIEKIDVNGSIVIIAIDSQWYLENWDNNPLMNDDCEIKTREDFFLEIEGIFKKNNEKTIIVAMHHPMFTNGLHGGNFPIDKHLFPFQSKIPLPVIGSLITQIRAQGGVSPQDRYHEQYNRMMKRLSTLARDTNKAIFVSGHEHNLQYIDHDGIKQIVSGAGSKHSAASLGNDGLFSYGGQGFTSLTVTKDGSSSVRYYNAKGGEPELLFQTEVHTGQDDSYDTSGLSSRFESNRTATIYDKEAVDKKKSYKKLWGNHYRYVYGTDIKVPVATLDTLMGGLSIDRKGGGHQTRSLRLIDKNGRNYALRAVKKSAVQFLQSVVFKENFIRDEFKDSFTENTLLDFYTSSHPYATFAIGPLADAIGVYHTNPQLLYVPKHPALGKYNADYGDELYIIEERPDDGFLDVASFGKPDDIESTADVLKKLRRDEKYQMDETAYIRARLFDMLLGDWDRHADQWRWARFDGSDGIKRYRPIPRDRDQAFSNYDGKLLDFFRLINPPARQFQEYDGELKDIKWINSAGIKLDRGLTGNSNKEDWVKQAEYIQNNLTDAVIDDAFDEFPQEVQDDVLEGIKAKLKERKGYMQDIASRYFDYLSQLVVITGTDKDDYFDIVRGNGTTSVDVFRIKGGTPEAIPYRSYTVNSKDTDEIWLYGLDDSDSFKVSGKGKRPVPLRIIGGQGDDQYTIENGRKVKLYNHRDQPNTIIKNKGAVVRNSHNYSYNTYNFNKTLKRVNNVIPSLGGNPDDGIRIGLQDIYTISSFKDVPYASRHIFKAGYFTASSSFDLGYEGTFINTVGKWDLDINVRYTSDGFARNFFGIGNETENFDANIDDFENTDAVIDALGLNDEDDLDLDFNRVRNRNLALGIGLIRDNRFGSVFSIKGIIENIEIDSTSNRIVTVPGLGRINDQLLSSNPDIFDDQTFLGGEAAYNYTSADNAANPSRGMIFGITLGGKTNLDDSDRSFGYVKHQLAFYNALTRNKKLVLKTQIQGQYNTGSILENYDFFQGATLGANTGLRAYRNERFTGESSFVGSADLRYSFKRTRTGLLPVQLGIFSGFDVGRVWVDNDPTSDANVWHSGVGGGFWVNAVDLISGQLGVFTGDDGIRINFGFGVRL